MARDKESVNTEKNKRRGRRGRIVRWTLLALVILMLGTVVRMSVEASVVHLLYADVQLSDLPRAFEGFKILFVSDLHLDALHSSSRVYSLMRQLSQLEPDLILMGGDYSSFGLDSMLKYRTKMSSYTQEKKRETTRVDQFFLLMDNIQPPYGKYGVAGNHDQGTEKLEESMALGHVTLLRNQIAEIKKDGEKLVLVGMDDWWSGERRVAQLAEMVRGRDCVILLSHNPDSLPTVSNQPASDGLQWADLMLSGHTHGGQVRPFGLDIRSVSEYGTRYRTGWISESATELLVSNGVGTTGVPFRMNAPAQAHLLTLHCTDAPLD